jgi:hypothetical protein
VIIMGIEFADLAASAANRAAAGFQVELGVDPASLAELAVAVASLKVAQAMGLIGPAEITFSPHEPAEAEVGHDAAEIAPPMP